MEKGSGYVSGQFQLPRSHGILVLKEKSKETSFYKSITFREMFYRTASLVVPQS